MQLLQAQKAIDKVENEATQYLIRDMITCMHKKLFKIDVDDASDKMYVSTISVTRVLSWRHPTVSSESIFLMIWFQ